MTRRLSGLTNSNNWVKFWEFTLAQSASDWEIKKGLPEQQFAITIDDSHVIAIKVLVGNDPGTWYRGGFANQRFRTGLNIDGIVDSEVGIAKKFLALRRNNLCIFPKIATEWALSIEFWNYFQSVDVTCHKYIGEDIDPLDLRNPNEAINLDARLRTIEGELERTLDQLDIIENQL